MAKRNKLKVSLYDKSIWILLIWTIFQDFALGLFYHYTNNAAITKLIFYTKDVMMVLLYVCAFLKRKATRYNAFVQLAYIILICLQIILSLLTNEYSAISLLASTRSLMLLPAFYLIGFEIKDKEKFRENLKNKYLPFLVFVAFAGIVEYILDLFIGTKEFWTNVIQIGRLHSDIKKQAGRLYMGLPGNFYTYSSKGGFTLKRLVSFWGTPLTSGYCLLLPCLYYFFSCLNNYKEKKYGKKYQQRNSIFMIIGLIALVMTVTRAIILPTMIVLIIAILLKQRKYKQNALIIFSTGFCLFVLFAFSQYEKIFSYLYNGSTIVHIDALFITMEKLNLMGQGVASFGASGFFGTESAYLAVLGQLGLLGLMLYLFMFIFPLQKCWNVYKNSIYGDTLLLTIVVSGVVYLFTGIISEQLTAYTTIVPFYIFLGCETGYWHEQKKAHFRLKE